MKLMKLLYDKNYSSFGERYCFDDEFTSHKKVEKTVWGDLHGFQQQESYSDKIKNIEKFLR